MLYDAMYVAGILGKLKCVQVYSCGYYAKRDVRICHDGRGGGAGRVSWPPENPQNMHNDNRTIPVLYNNHTIPFLYKQCYAYSSVPAIPHSDHTLYPTPLLFPRHVYHDDIVVWDGESVGEQNKLGLII